MDGWRAGVSAAPAGRPRPAVGRFGIGFTPTYGSAVGRFAAGYSGTAEAVPLSKADRTSPTGEILSSFEILLI